MKKGKRKEWEKEKKGVKKEKKGEREKIIKGKN